MIVIGFITFLVVVVNSSSDIERATHLPRVDGLPASASDITYAKRTGFGWYLTYECSLPESDFQSLAQKEDWPVRDATNVNISGWRSGLNLPELSTNEFGLPSSMVERALFFKRRYQNNGGTTVIYDRQRQRLFFNESHR